MASDAIVNKQIMRCKLNFMEVLFSRYAKVTDLIMAGLPVYRAVSFFIRWWSGDDSGSLSIERPSKTQAENGAYLPYEPHLCRGMNSYILVFSHDLQAKCSLIFNLGSCTGPLQRPTQTQRVCAVKAHTLLSAPPVWQLP